MPMTETDTYEQVKADAKKIGEGAILLSESVSNYYLARFTGFLSAVMGIAGVWLEDQTSQEEKEQLADLLENQLQTATTLVKNLGVIFEEANERYRTS